MKSPVITRHHDVLRSGTTPKVYSMCCALIFYGNMEKTATTECESVLKDNESEREKFLIARVDKNRSWIFCGLPVMNI